MKIAECRVKDPRCGDSRTPASIAAQELRARRSQQQIQAALRDSDLARTRRAGLFGEPVKLTLAGSSRARAGVTGTPSFFIYGRHYRSSMDPETVAPMLDEELKKISTQ
jgi:protein-disulfide isomerase